MSDWRFTNPNAKPRIVVRDGVAYEESPTNIKTSS